MIEDIGAMSQTDKTEIPNWRLGYNITSPQIETLTVPPFFYESINSSLARWTISTDFSNRLLIGTLDV